MQGQTDKHNYISLASSFAVQEEIAQTIVKEFYWVLHVHNVCASLFVPFVVYPFFYFRKEA